jgi:hypothetical protein
MVNYGSLRQRCFDYCVHYCSHYNAIFSFKFSQKLSELALSTEAEISIDRQRNILDLHLLVEGLICLFWPPQELIYTYAL